MVRWEIHGACGVNLGLRRTWRGQRDARAHWGITVCKYGPGCMWNMCLLKMEFFQERKLATCYCGLSLSLSLSLRVSVLSSLLCLCSSLSQTVCVLDTSACWVWSVQTGTKANFFPLSNRLLYRLPSLVTVCSLWCLETSKALSKWERKAQHRWQAQRWWGLLWFAVGTHAVILKTTTMGKGTPRLCQQPPRPRSVALWRPSPQTSMLRAREGVRTASWPRLSCGKDLQLRV